MTFARCHSLVKGRVRRQVQRHQEIYMSVVVSVHWKGEEERTLIRTHVGQDVLLRLGAPQSNQLIELFDPWP